MKKFCVFAGALAMAISGAAMASTQVTVDISGAQSWELIGDPLNEHISVPGFSVGDIINSVSYSGTLTTFAPSWADEPRIGIGEGNNADFATLGPFGSATTVSNFAFSGSVAGISHVMGGSTLDLEFYETGFNDFSGAPDAIYNTGSLVINYTKIPAPSILAALGVAGLVSRRRRRTA